MILQIPPLTPYFSLKLWKMYPSPEARSDLEITGLKLSEEFAFTETQVSSRVPSNTSCPRHQTNPKDTRDHTRSRDPSPHSLPWAT